MNNNDNDLQRAIDDIARSNNPEGPNTVDEVLQGVGVGVGDIPPAPAPVVPDMAPPAPTPAPVEPADVTAQYVEPTQEPQQAQGEVAEEAQNQEAPQQEEDLRSMDTNSVKDRAIDELKPIIGTIDLTPIVGKVDLSPETKFKIYRSIIETTRDKSVLGPAYATAKEITSDESRAEALLYLVEMAEKLG